MAVFSTAEILSSLATPEGRAQLHAYALTHDGHLDLTAAQHMLRNSFARAILNQILTDSALEAVSADPRTLTLTASDKLPVLLMGMVAPRPAMVPFTQEDCLTFLADLFKRNRVKADDLEWVMEDLLSDFRRKVEYVIDVPGPANPSAKLFPELMILWNAFDYQITANNERRILEKQKRARDEFLAYLFSTTRPSPHFVDMALYGSENNWSEFFSLNIASAGTLVRMAKKNHIEPEAWEIVVTRSKDSYLDALVVAAAHPSMLAREEAVMAVQAPVPFDMHKTDVYSLIEVAKDLPDSVQRFFMEDVARTLKANWHRDEYADWLVHGSRWGYHTESKTIQPVVKQKRWWQS